jgi:VanZ family protein
VNSIKEKITEMIVSWAPALIVMVIIFTFSNTPGPDLPNLGVLDTLFKKGAHMTGYALLAMGFTRGINRLDRKALLGAWILAVLYAATDEYHQVFIPGRHPSPVDVGIDSVGAMFGLFLITKVSILRRFVIRKRV